MSQIEYNNLLFEISESLDGQNVRKRLLFLCREKLASESELENSIPDVLSLFKELEARNHLGLDRLGIMKTLLKGVKEYVLLGKVKKFENERKKYLDLLEKIIPTLEELNDLERLISICRTDIPEENEGNIHDVRSLFTELENQSCLGTDSLGVLKGILTETEQNNLLKELEEFEERRNRVDQFETRKAQASAFVSSVRNNLIGVLNIKTVFKVVAGGLITASTLDVWSRGSSFDELVTAVNHCVLPAGTRLIQITEGCVRLTIQAEKLSALDTLWSLYQNGTLKKRLETFFVNDELRELAGGEQVEAIVTIEDQEYDRARVTLTRKTQEEELTMIRQRRNSDSDLYCKARYHEDAASKERTNQAKKSVSTSLDEGPDCQQEERSRYLDEERLAFVQNYLEKIDDAGSMTTETSDSGMLGTHGAPSEFGIAETGDSTYRLCLKDLRREMVVELTGRLESDPIALELFRESFGLPKTHNPIVLRGITELFPDTPVMLLKDVFEALQLHDLVEVLEKAKPRTLRPAFSFKEIGKLPNASNRHTTYYSKAAVLIIDNKENASSDISKKIESFFTSVNSQSQVTTITVGQSLKNYNDLKRLVHEMEEERMEMEQMESRKKLLKYELEMEMPHRRKSLDAVLQRYKDGKEFKRKRAESQMRMAIEGEHAMRQRLQRLTDEEHAVRQSLQTLTANGELLRRTMEEKKNLLQKELQQETEKIQMAVSAVVDKWINSEDKNATLYSVLNISGDTVYDTYETIDSCLRENLALIPDQAKLLITPGGTDWVSLTTIPETLHVTFSFPCVDFVTTMLAILSKRWQSSDLISMLREVQRTITFKSHSCRGRLAYRLMTVKDTLSSIPRLHKKATDNSSI